ncbi:MAG: DeoR/GlpR family DNA-binding transcription regulator [Chthonomonadales bacterium]
MGNHGTQANGAKGQEPLFAEERRQAILERLRLEGKVTVEGLAAEFGVSLPTARTDLAQLEARGLLRRTHGGAIPASATLFEPPYGERRVMHHAEKRAIARRAAEYVKDGDTIFLDAGTTLYEFALALRGHRRLTVVTNSLVSALALMDHAGTEVILVGGLVQPRRRAVLGPLAERFVEAFHVDRAFVSFNGVHPQAGFSVVDFDAAEIKARMMAHAEEVIVLADWTKIGKIAFAAVAPIGAAQVLVTDHRTPPELTDELTAAGLQIVRAQL